MIPALAFSAETVVPNCRLLETRAAFARLTSLPVTQEESAVDVSLCAAVLREQIEA